MLRTTSSFVAKFARRTPVSAALAPSSLATTTARGMTVLSKESASEFEKGNYSSRMAATRRPVSPHVTIYSFPVAALTSIVNRVTGCALSFGAAGIGAVELFGGSGAALELMSSVGSSGGLVVAGAKFSVAFPVVYHYLGGVRHLVWDNSPEMLTNLGVEKMSYILVGSSVLLSGVATVL